MKKSELKQIIKEEVDAAVLKLKKEKEQEEKEKEKLIQKGIKDFGYTRTSLEKYSLLNLQKLIDRKEANYKAEKDTSGKVTSVSRKTPLS